MESSLQHQKGHRLCRFWRKKLCLLLGQNQHLRSYRLQRNTNLQRLGPTRLHHMGYDFKSTMRYWHCFAQHLEIVACTDRCQLSCCLHSMHWCYSLCSSDCLQNWLSHCSVNSSRSSARQLFDSTVCNGYSNQQLLSETLRTLHLESRAFDSH